MELNNVQPPATNIQHISVGPSHTLEIIPKTQVSTPGSSSSPQGINVLTTPASYSKTLRTHGKNFNLFSTLNIPTTQSQIQTLLLHKHHTTRLKLMKKNINKLKNIWNRDKYVVPSAIMKKPQATCLHPAIHPLHDCRHKWNLIFYFKLYESLL